MATPRVASQVLWATIDDPLETQRRADVVIDVREGRVVKNRFGYYTNTHYINALIGTSEV